MEKKKKTCLVVHIRLSLLYIKDPERVWKVWKWELLARYKSLWSVFFFAWVNYKVWSHCCLPLKFCCVSLIVFHYLIIILSEEQHWGVFLKWELLVRYKSLSSFFSAWVYYKVWNHCCLPPKFCCVPLIVCHYLIIILPEEQHCKSISSMKAVSYWPEPRHFDLGCSMLTAGLLPPPQCAGCKFLWWKAV